MEKVPGWLDELRLDPGPPFSTMGMRSLNPPEWLIVDDYRDRDLTEKAQLLEAARSAVFATQPHTEEPALELLELIREWLSQRGISVRAPASAEHPLVEAAMSVQEDLVILQRSASSWVVTAGAVCFPTYWSIRDKVGMPLADVHAPVAHYERELSKRVDRFHDRLAADRPAWRRNWFVVPTNEMHLAPAAHPEQFEARIADDGSPMWIRSERQTLRRLPRTGAIVFTIRVQHAPLGVLRQRADRASSMLAAISSWDSDKRRYTSTGGALDALIGWLRNNVDEPS